MAEAAEKNQELAGVGGTEPRTIAVIDGNSLMHRAFHAIRQPMTAPDGRATNALFGFFNMFVKFVESFDPDGVICAFDKGKPRVRMEMLPQYKAQRPPMDPALHEQFPMVKDLLRTLDVPVVELEGWEGDDILGTLARRGEEAGYVMLLVTGDRDMYQLSTERVRIVSTRKGTSDVAVMTPDSVNDLYNGITPDLVPDFYGLKGDSSDNIPGVPGIGPKKAAALITQYGSLDAVIEHADEVKGKMGENLRAHVEDALLSRKVATIRTDAPLDVDLADAKFPTFDPDEVATAFSALGFTGMVQRVTRLAGGVAKAPAAPAPTFVLPEPLTGTDADVRLARAIREGEWVCAAIDVPAPRKGQQSLFDEAPQRSLWLQVGGASLCYEGDEAMTRVAGELLECGRLASADVKSVVRLVCPPDSAHACALSASAVDPARIFDLGVAAYLLDSDAGAYAPRELFARYGEGTLPAPDDDLPEARVSVAACEALLDTLVAHLDAEGARRLMDDIEMPLLPVLAQMEREGLRVDTAILAEQDRELGQETDRLVAHIKQEAGEDFNLDSPQQLSHVLFDVLGLPTAGLKKTKKGFYSTNAKVLGDLARDNEVVAEVLEYRERAKISSTYLRALPGDVRDDGRIHTTLNQTVAATGRLSSSSPNLQNIPTRSELGHRVRAAFTVPEGSVFLACDYSQIELRLLAHLSADEHLVAAFNEGEDFHAATAARVFGVPVAEVTPALRSRAKAVNFGIVYGQQAYGLASSLKIGRAEAQDMIDRYFDAYPGVRAYLDESVELARKLGYAETMYGRRRHIRDINSRNFQLRSFGERTAMNHPMQGTAADIIKIAMVRVADRLREEGMRSKLVLQIHDELDLEVPEDEISVVSELVEKTMEGVAELRVPLIADVSYGANWAEAK